MGRDSQEAKKEKKSCLKIKEKAARGRKLMLATWRRGALSAAWRFPPEAETSVNSSDLMAAVKDLKSDLARGNDSLRQEINLMSQEINGKLDNLSKEVQNLSGSVDEAETRVGRMEDWAAEVNAVMSAAAKQQQLLQAKVTDLESRSRRNNIRIFGVAEGEEGNSVPHFITTLLKRELSLPQDLDLKIQRAHRSVAQKPLPEYPPRPIIINFHEFTTKELVLKEAWRKGKISVGNRVIYFDHDYAAEIVKKRKEYNPIKRVLKEKGIRFQTPYTNMRIHWDSGVRTYDSADAAWQELHRRGYKVDPPHVREGETALDSHLSELLGWVRRADRREKGSSTSQRAREKLREFQRDNTAENA